MYQNTLQLWINLTLKYHNLKKDQSILLLIKYNEKPFRYSFIFDFINGFQLFPKPNKLILKLKLFSLFLKNKSNNFNGISTYFTSINEDSKILFTNSYFIPLLNLCGYPLWFTTKSIFQIIYTTQHPQ